MIAPSGAIHIQVPSDSAQKQIGSLELRELHRHSVGIPYILLLASLRIGIELDR